MSWAQALLTFVLTASMSMMACHILCTFVAEPKTAVLNWMGSTLQGGEVMAHLTS